MSTEALPPVRRLAWGGAFGEAAAAAALALVLAIPLVGFQTVETNATLGIRTRFGWVALGVAAVFVGRLALSVFRSVRPHLRSVTTPTSPQPSPPQWGGEGGIRCAATGG